VLRPPPACRIAPVPWRWAWAPHLGLAWSRLLPASWPTCSKFGAESSTLHSAASVAMLTWHNVWMASHGRQMARELKRRAPGQDRRTHLDALASWWRAVAEAPRLCCPVWHRRPGGTTATAGGAGWILAAAGVSALMYLVCSASRGKLFQSPVVDHASGGAWRAAVIFLQNGGCWNSYQHGVDTSWLIKDDSIAAAAAHFGRYARRPMGAAAGLWRTIALILVLMRLVNAQSASPKGTRLKLRLNCALSGTAMVSAAVASDLRA